MTYLDQKIKERIKEKLERLNKFRPLPVSVVKKLKSSLRLK